MTVPNHIGVILDGNRRFAKRLMLKPWKGHEWGAKKFRDFLGWCKETGIKEVTAYTFSIQNFNRPKQEFDYLMEIFRKEFTDSDFEKECHEKGIKVRFIGRTWKFPQDVQEAMKNIETKTSRNGPYTVNLAMAYGGREEVLDAVQKIAQQVKEGKLDTDAINEETFGKELYLNSDPELIIRTGGEMRTSNFLAWQGIYAEWFFIEKPWPELQKEDFQKIIAEYESRDRRFGK